MISVVKKLGILMNRKQKNRINYIFDNTDRHFFGSPWSFTDVTISYSYYAA